MAYKSKTDLQSAAKALGVSTDGTRGDISTRITQFGYNAAVTTGKRQAPQTRVTHESVVLPPSKRTKLIATAQDQVRNHALVAWMLRKHLDYVSMFGLEVTTKKKKLKSQIERIFEWHGKKRNFDVTQRLGRDEFFRFFEAEKVAAGDAAFIKLGKLRKIQGIESDLIAKPAMDQNTSKGDKELFKKLTNEGLIKGEFSEITKYCICNRGEGGKTVEFDHFEDAVNVVFDAYFSRFSSQNRGVSPLSTAINTVQDISEGMEYNVVKAKMHALFGIAITRDPQGTAEFGGAGGATSETAEASETDTDSHLELNPTKINILDMNEGEDAKVIESGTPSIEFISAMHLYIHIAMLALDIPVTCFDSRKSSFSARIADLNEYEVSIKPKQAKNREVREEYSSWLLETIYNDKKSPWKLKEMADAANVSLDDLKSYIEWIPNGSPWLDKFKQLQGDQLGIDLCLDNHIDAARRRGSDVFKNIDKQSEVLAYAKKKNVPIMVGGSGTRSSEEIIAEEVQRQNEADAGIGDDA